ncbi:hypothetical protein [Micromonospora sp. WMMD737]|uniref:hypothetical protein n=1 Tax=Micromonospora sp. WMMD737 TaxID=3404113 RepID=UPI003B93592B
MVDAALVGLATAGGTALIGAVAEDTWQLAKNGFGRLFGRGDQAQMATTEERLERTRVAIESAGSDAERVKAEQHIAWRARLEDFLAENPGAAEELQSLIGQINAGGSSRSTGYVTQNAAAFDNAQQVIQGHGHQSNVFGAGQSDGGR